MDDISIGMPAEVRALLHMTGFYVTREPVPNSSRLWLMPPDQLTYKTIPGEHVNYYGVMVDHIESMIHE